VAVGGGDDDDDSDGATKDVSVTSKQSGAVLLRGWITLGKSPGPNIGGYAELQAIKEKGMFLMRVMEASTPHGYCSIIDHDRVEIDLGDGRMLLKVSGFSPDDSSTDESRNNDLARVRRVVTIRTAMHRAILPWVGRLK
jgi:hypothetical protein